MEVSFSTNLVVWATLAQPQKQVVTIPKLNAHT